MKKISVIYWSGTGNTEAMAKAVAEGAKNEETEVALLHVSEAKEANITAADAIALGCPSMGAEMLEESEMEPFVASIEPLVSGKPLALFGSYGWGNGEWMQDWVGRMGQCGAKVLGEGLIIRDTPDDQGLADCKALGNILSQAK
jgi:flavodoxin I